MNLETFFEPRTMAVVGVSLSNDRHPANVIFNKNLLRYPVKVFPVNPKGGVLVGERVFRHIAEIDHDIDMAVIAVRSEHAAGVLRDCIESGVGAATVISGGFAERGQRELQDHMVAMAKEAGFPFLGPNCLGIYAPSRVDTFFLPSERMVRPEAGNVAMVSQSGGILVDQMVKFADQGIGLSVAVSIGNKALIRELDLLEYLVDDPKTDVISFYVEGFERDEGREFVLAAGRSPKPVIVLKAGKSPGGGRAVSSHTASLAGDYQVFASILSQHGIVEAHNEFELISFCESLSCYQRSIEGRIGIITPSGGHGALSVDEATAHGLTVPPIPRASQEEIRSSLSRSIQPIASVENPIDLTASALDEDFVFTAEYLSKQPSIDCLLVLLLPYSPTMSSDLGAKLSQVYLRQGKPIVAYVPHVEKFRIMIEGFELNRMPVAHSIEGAVLMAEAMRRCKPC
jgi:acetyltransferase